MATTPPAKRVPKKKSNPLRAGQHIDYKDTATLRKFISERGKIRSRRITGACRRHQSQIARAVKRARELALLPYVNEGAREERPGGRGDRDRDRDR
jgi:small subunit ribosomal protein S18